jgi:CheY-like chemotaxis protein/anti-sigma regulatory factor (Ser/Thr protein kinase)
LVARPVHLPVVVDGALDALRTMADARRVQLRTTVDPGLGPVMADPDRLRQVVWNLLSNAIKFTPEGGTVALRVERVVEGARITVKDTGKGISREFLPRVFERFTQAESSSTRPHGGLGLGLAIARHLVELHGGSVRAESDGEGLGATFTVDLPLLAAADACDVPSHPAPAVERIRDVHMLAGVRILVVDDDRDMLELLCATLRQVGASVAAAASASEALEALDRVSPDILVSDIAMPDEDGYALIEKVRMRDRQMPAIALTAFAGMGDRTRALLAGYQIHLPKPVEPDQLLAVIAQLKGAAKPADVSGGTARA